MIERARLLLLLPVAALLACGGREPLPTLPFSAVAEPPPDSIDSVIFFVGDLGNALWDESPLVQRMAREVEQYASALRRDSSVAIVFLGDNVYPGGLREAGRPEFFEDSARLEAQVHIFRGEEARAGRVFGVFIPGNHDWGHKLDEEGERRLRNMEEFLARRRERGIPVSLLPSSGKPGPSVVDVGSNVRIVILDTAWWLLSPNEEQKLETMRQLEAALLAAGSRATVLAAHHPFRSASSHGGLVPFWKTIGIKWLLHKSGAALQDLNSLPYRDLLDKLMAVFRKTGPPLLFAGGHDHVLQVLKAIKEPEPTYMLVSGAGSKLSKVGHAEGMLFRNDEPGFMRMIVRRNGGVDLFVVSAPEDFLECGDRPPAAALQCVQVGINEFHNSFSMRLR